MPSKKNPAGDLLAKYRAKRNFTRTAEPSGQEPPVLADKELRFCVQKHAATRLHYDFRLELDGVLKSWAVTKGPSFIPSERRLAVEVEDHPLAYGGFEGTIPQGQYGGGTVMLWDRGTWKPLEEPHQALKKGAMKLELHGYKLKGRWTLVRMPPRPKDRTPSWLLIKEKDAVARPNGPSLPEDDDESVLSGRSMQEIATGGQTRPRKRTPAALEFIHPELATLVDAPPTGRDWLHEMKFDGYRLMASVANGGVKLFTRRGLDWTHRFREIRDALHGLGQDAVIDGEAAVLNQNGISDFSALQAHLSGERTGTVLFLAFDLLFLDGQDCRSEPLLTRKKRLQTILEPLKHGGQIVYSDHVIGSGAAFLAEACKAGLEGIISKRTDSLYVSGRGRDWLKVKCRRQQEFVIGGFVPSTTGLAGIGSLAVGYYEEGKLVYAGRVGTGFSVGVSRTLRARLDKLVRKRTPFAGQLTREATKDVIWVKPELVAEVTYTEWTADRRLRHGSFEGLRDDKRPEEVAREQPIGSTIPEGAAVQQRSEAQVGGVRITHPDRVLDRETGLTKNELAEYYHAIADRILPHIVGRPLSFVRCPEGVATACFYQRHWTAGMPGDLQPVHLSSQSSEETYLAIEDVKGLLALVQFGVMEIHPWGAPVTHIDAPDRLIFDLDPDPSVAWAAVVDAALLLRERLKKAELRSFVKTTGGKGLHLAVPLDGTQDWETVKGFARHFAEALAGEQPDRFTAVMSKRERQGRIFIDYMRNERSATAISPYSTRARAGTPVATPLAWDELSPTLDPFSFTVRAVQARLQEPKKDPWKGFFTVRQFVS